jgi:hypothetical protein
VFAREISNFFVGDSKFREIMMNCTGTAMNSKLIASHRQFFSAMVVCIACHPKCGVTSVRLGGRCGHAARRELLDRRYWHQERAWRVSTYCLVRRQ